MEKRGSGFALTNYKDEFILVSGGEDSGFDWNGNSLGVGDKFERSVASAEVYSVAEDRWETLPEMV